MRSLLAVDIGGTKIACALVMQDGALIHKRQHPTDLSGPAAVVEQIAVYAGALPPGLPPVEIDGRWYWDGGIVSNTPLAHVLNHQTEAKCEEERCDVAIGKIEHPLNKTAFDKITDGQHQQRHEDKEQPEADTRCA